MKTLFKLLFVALTLLLSARLPAQINISAGDDTTVCLGSPARLGGFPTVIFGTPPYNYAWSPATGLSSTTIANPLATPTVTTTYTLTVTDGNNVTMSDVVVVNIATLNLSLTPSTTTANYFTPGNIIANVSGTGTITENWSHNGLAYYLGDTIAFNTPGSYVCFASNGYCNAIDSVVVTGNVSATVASAQNVLCNGSSDGSINVNVSGGTGNYTYIWSNGSNTANLSGLGAGTYQLTVYDNNGDVGYTYATITEPSPLSVTITQTPGNLPVTLTASVTGGTPAYTYQWSNLTQTQVTGVSQYGNYTLTVTDANACTITANANIGAIQTFPDSISMPVNSSTVIQLRNIDSIASQAPGVYAVATITNAPIYGTATIDPFDPTIIHYTPNSNFIGADSIFYSLCFVDSAPPPYTPYMCSNSWIYIDVKDSFNLNAQGNPESCPGSCDGSISLGVIGGVPPFTYSWNMLQTVQNPTGLCPGAYTVTVTDGNNTTGTASATVLASNLQITFTDSAINNSGRDSILITAHFNGSGNSWNFSWDGGITYVAIDSTYRTSSSVVGQSGVYCVSASSFLCSVTACDTVGCIGCVWPGDANDDGIADNNDLLQIGLGYGATGTTRAGATSNWVGQTATDWGSTLGGIDEKFVDCDGNGTINANDTIPLALNFGLTHLRSGGVDPWRSNTPALTVNLIPDTVHAGDIMQALVSLGDSNTIANNVYGIAFTVNYDNLVVDSTGTSASFGNSWLGNNTNKISIAHDFPSAGQVKCAITRIDHTNQSGWGQIGTVSFVITTDNINGKDFAYYGMQVWLSDIRMIDNQGNILQVNAGRDSTQVEYTPSGIDEIALGKEISMFPNPANGQLVINTKQLALQQVELIDISGRTVLQQTVQNLQHYTLNVSQLCAGIYFAQITTDKGKITKRLAIQR